MVGVSTVRLRAIHAYLSSPPHRVDFGAEAAQRKRLVRALDQLGVRLAHRLREDFGLLARRGLRTTRITSGTATSWSVYMMTSKVPASPDCE